MDKNIERMKKCPRFSHCSVPKCPLDQDIDLRVKLPGEPNCTLAKSRRIKLGKDLPRGGMTKREFSGLKNWQKSSEKSKANVLKNLSAGREKLGIT